MHHDPLSLLESSPRVQIMVQITRQHSLEREKVREAWADG